MKRGASDMEVDDAGPQRQDPFTANDPWTAGAHDMLRSTRRISSPMDFNWNTTNKTAEGDPAQFLRGPGWRRIRPKLRGPKGVQAPMRLGHGERRYY